MLGNLFSQHKEPKLPEHPISDPAATQQTSSDASTQTQVVTETTVGSRMDPAMRQNLSALSHLDARTTQVLHHAQDEAKRIKQAHIEPEQILVGLLYDEDIFKLLEQFNVDVAALGKEIQSKELVGDFIGMPTLSDATTQLFEQAYRETKARNVSFVSPEDLLVVLCNSSIAVAKILSDKGVKKEQIQEKLATSVTYKQGKQSILEQYGIDLTEEARAGKLDPITGRDKEIERLIHILLRRTKNNPIIIGEAGVGKTAIVEGLAQKIVSGDVPEQLKNKRIFQLDLASLVAGASKRGEFEERLKGVINEAIASAGQIILFIDEIHTLIGAGDTDGALDASNIIKPHLARGHMQIIGTTTTTEFRQHFEKDKAFERRFQQILADEPDEETAVEMLKVLRPKYEKFHGVTYPDETLVAAVKLSKKYIGERYLPDKAVDLLDEAGAEVKLEHDSGKKQDTQVVKGDIEKVVSSWTGIPITKLTEDEGQKLLKLEKRIHQRLIDQEEAVVAVSEAVRRGRIGLAPANRPIASFIFLGPSGVGKTELAKTLAEILFGRDDALVRLDMSEYMEKHEVAKLIGAPPGYVGYEEGGQLTEAVRAKPYSIVLLDEVEKAHPDVFNILLQVLEDGRLTDNKGNTISFKNTIVICTSNIGSALIQQQLSEKDANAPAPTPEQFNEDFAKLSELVNGELRKFFRPELLNRFDDIVIFKPLRRQDMTEIAKLGIAKTGKLLEEQGYHIQTTDAAITQLAQEGYDPVYGARPLRRLIQTSIENQIALLLIGKTFVPGDTIVIDYNSTKSAFAFSKGAPQPANAGDGVEGQAEQGGQEAATTDAKPASEVASQTDVTQEILHGAPAPDQPQAPIGNGQAQQLPEEKPAEEPQHATPDFRPPFLMAEEKPAAATSGEANTPTNGIATGTAMQPNVTN
jgi:ATP-dependent Clp protease ATP-binding subunit ClpC